MNNTTTNFLPYMVSKIQQHFVINTISKHADVCQYTSYSFCCLYKAILCFIQQLLLVSCTSIGSRTPSLYFELATSHNMLGYMTNTNSKGLFSLLMASIEYNKIVHYLIIPPIFSDLQSHSASKYSSSI